MTKAIAGIALFAVLISGAVWWKIYAYGDCRNVGHSKLYCTVNLFSR